MSSKLKIISDLDCQIYCDDEYVGEMVSGKMFHLNLRKGVYLLEFKTDTALLATQRYKMESNDEEDLLEVSLIDTYNIILREARRENVKNLNVRWLHTGENWRIASTKDEILNPVTKESWIDLPSNYILLPIEQHREENSDIDPDVDCCGYIPFNIGGTLHFDDEDGHYITGGMWGCINKVGEVIIRPLYSRIVFFYNDQVCCVYDHQRVRRIINYLGENVFGEHGVVSAINEHKGVYKTVKDNKHGLIDKYGNVLINPCFSDLEYAGDECIWAKDAQSNRWGLLDIASNVILPFIYGNIQKTRGGYYVCCNEKWGSVTNNGIVVKNNEYVIVATFQINECEIDPSCEEHYDYRYFSIVKNNNKYGILNTDFKGSYLDEGRSVVIKEIIPCIYDAIYSKDGEIYNDEKLVELCTPEYGYPDGRFNIAECYFVTNVNGELECNRYGAINVNDIEESRNSEKIPEYTFKCETFNSQYMIESKKYHFINEKSIYEEDSYDLISKINFYDGTISYIPDNWDSYPSPPSSYIKAKSIRTYPIAKKGDTWYVFNNIIPRSLLFSCKCNKIEQFGCLVSGENFAVVEFDCLRYLYIIDDSVVVYKSEAMSGPIISPYSSFNSSHIIWKTSKDTLDDRYQEGLKNDYFIVRLNTTRKQVVMKWSVYYNTMLYSDEYDQVDIIDEDFVEVSVDYKGRKLYNTIYTATDEILQVNGTRWKLTPYEERNINMVAEHDCETDKEGIICYTPLNNDRDIRDEILENNIFKSEIIVPFVWDYARVYGTKWPIIMVGNYVHNHLRCAIMDDHNRYLTDYIYSEIYYSGGGICTIGLGNGIVGCFDVENYNPYYYLPFIGYEKYVGSKLIPFNPFRNVRLYIDTETTGLPIDYKEHYTKLENWPYIVQVALIIEDDNYGILAKRDIIVKPDGYTIPESSYKIHGITNEKAESGEKREDVFGFLDEILNNTDIIIGHNASFDLNIIRAEIIRTKGKGNVLFEKKKHKVIDTMRIGKDLCKIPGNFMYGGYKYPKLDELYYKLFNKHFENQHNAMADIEATFECYKELVKLNMIVE